MAVLACAYGVLKAEAFGIRSTFLPQPFTMNR